MVAINLRMTVSESTWVVTQAIDKHDSNISAYIRSLVHRDKWGKLDELEEPT